MRLLESRHGCQTSARPPSGIPFRTLRLEHQSYRGQSGRREEGKIRLDFSYTGEGLNSCIVFAEFLRIINNIILFYSPVDGGGEAVLIPNHQNNLIANNGRGYVARKTSLGSLHCL